MESLWQENKIKSLSLGMSVEEKENKRRLMIKKMENNCSCRFIPQ